MADYDYEEYDDFVDDEEFEDGGVVSDSTEVVLEEDEEVVETGRVTEKPETDTVEFTVVKSFTWHGTEFEVGEHELPQDDYEAMMYDINLRQDRLVLVL